ADDVVAGFDQGPEFAFEIERREKEQSKSAARGRGGGDQIKTLGPKQLCERPEHGHLRDANRVERRLGQNPASPGAFERVDFAKDIHSQPMNGIFASDRRARGIQARGPTRPRIVVRASRLLSNTAARKGLSGKSLQSLHPPARPPYFPGTSSKKPTPSRLRKP